MQFVFYKINLSQNFPVFTQRNCPKWGLFLVGSTISGFGSDTSDIDMCLVSKGNGYSDFNMEPRVEAMVALNDLKNYLAMSMSEFFIKSSDEDGEWFSITFQVHSKTSFWSTRRFPSCDSAMHLTRSRLTWTTIIVLAFVTPTFCTATHNVSFIFSETCRN